MYELFVAVRQREKAGGRGGQWVDIGAAGSVELYTSVVFYLFCLRLSVEFYQFCYNGAGCVSVEFYLVYNGAGCVSVEFYLSVGYRCAWLRA